MKNTAQPLYIENSNSFPILCLFQKTHNKIVPEVLYGVESAVRRGVQFMQNVNKWMDLYGDENGPSIIIEFPDIYKNNYIEARRRGDKIRLSHRNY